MIVVMGALLIPACGGGGGGGETVSAEEFASGICGALNDWQSAIQSRSSSLTEGLSEDTTPEQGKELLASFLDDVIDETETMISEVDDTGVPDVDNGEDISDALGNAFDDALAALEDARDQVDDLPTDSGESFQTAASALGGSISTSLGDIGGEIQDIDAPGLEDAFREDEDCIALQGL
jgi:hypothetical protein